MPTNNPPPSGQAVCETCGGSGRLPYQPPALDYALLGTCSVCNGTGLALPPSAATALTGAFAPGTVVTQRPGLVQYFVYCDHTPDELIGRNVYLAAPVDSLLSALRAELDDATASFQRAFTYGSECNTKIEALRAERDMHERQATDWMLLAERNAETAGEAVAHNEALRAELATTREALAKMTRDRNAYRDDLQDERADSDRYSRERDEARELLSTRLNCTHCGESLGKWSLHREWELTCEFCHKVSVFAALAANHAQDGAQK